MSRRHSAVEKAAPITVLVAEDELLTRTMLVVALREAGLDAQPITPDRALAAVQTAPHAILVTRSGPLAKTAYLRALRFVTFTMPVNLTDLQLAIITVAKEQLPPTANHSELLIYSSVLRAHVETARRVADLKSTVMLYGETGVGKGVFADYLHHTSQRRAGPLIKVNCGGIPAELLESELFGHKRGSYTGALEDRRGKIEAANGGTLFLDEIGELPLASQPKLLQFLEDHYIVRVGENEPRALDVRIVAATNRNLRESVRAGQFREDLYYRLNVISLTIPPLRDRRDEILPLADHFLAKYNRLARRACRLADSARLRLQTHHWPGNVRELMHGIERAVAIAPTDQIDADLLTESLFTEKTAAPRVSPAPGPVCQPLDAYLEKQTTAYILRALMTTDGNCLKAAALLGVTPATFYRRSGRARAAFNALADSPLSPLAGR